MQALPTFPYDDHWFYTIRLGDTSYLFECGWNQRTRGWYASLKSEDGSVEYFTGRRVSPGARLNRWVFPEDGGPDGSLIVKGDTDPYGRYDLGETLHILWIPSSETLDLLPSDAFLTEPAPVLV